MIPKKDFLHNAELVIRLMDEYYNGVEHLPVRPSIKPKHIYRQIPESAPENAEPFEQILEDLREIIIPGMTNWQHPNFHGYFPANNSVESILGEFVSATLGAQCMNWLSSPAAAELEERTMEWVAKALGLPTDFEGVIQDTASTATLVAIITAREKACQFKSNFEGVLPGLRVYCSLETHSSIEKAVRLSGIGSNNLKKIQVDENQRMIPGELEKQITDDIQSGYTPICVVAALGTTGTVGIDPIDEIAQICKKHKIWLHIDAAYAGSALILPEYRWMSGGIEHADSFVFNAHKWMFTNFDCSCYFVKDVSSLLRSFEITPEYLKTPERGLVNDYKDWGIQLGRRFRALKLWFVLRSFGIKGIQARLRDHIQYNKWFAAQIESSENFEIVSGPFLNFTGFRYHPKGIEDSSVLNNLNQHFLQTINNTGKLFLTHTMLQDTYILRFVIGQTYAQQSHAEKAWKIISKIAIEINLDS